MTESERRQRSKEVLEMLDAKLELIKEQRIGGRYYNEFIADAVRELRNDNQVLCFFKYQFDELRKYFGDTLVYEYDRDNKWWVCHLEYKKNSNTDEDGELMHFIEKSGLTPRMVLKYIKPKVDLIKTLYEK